MHQVMQAYTHRFKAMGSPCELQFYSTPAVNKKATALARMRLEHIERKYTRYQVDSITSQINTAAGNAKPITVDNETLGLLRYADTLYEQSGGMFDITSGVLRRAWDFHSRKLPTAEKVARILPLIGWSKVDLQASCFSLPLKGMEIDFGGFVKEYAADQIAQLLQNNGIANGVVNLGGDIVVLGPHPNGDPWQVGIQHPRVHGEAIAQIPLKHGALASSGDYERFMLINGKRYSHLLNPKTGWPVQCAFASVTAVANQCLIAGSFSSIAMLKSENEPNWLNNSGVSYLLVDQALQLSGNIACAKNKRPDR